MIVLETVGDDQLRFGTHEDFIGRTEFEFFGVSGISFI